jgi:hypothetical protein
VTLRVQTMQMGGIHHKAIETLNVNHVRILLKLILSSLSLVFSFQMCKFAIKIRKIWLFMTSPY